MHDSPTWSLRTCGPQSETARRLLALDGARDRQLVADIDLWAAEYELEPHATRAGLLSRLQGSSESHFRGAVWELFWLATCRSLDEVVRLEHRDEPDATGKTVDFLLDGLGIAVEVTSVNQLDADVRAEYWRRDLLTVLEASLRMPGYTVSMSVRASGSAAPDISQIKQSVQDWFYDFVVDRLEDRTALLRLDLGWHGWVVDFELHDVADEQLTYVTSSRPGQSGNADERTRLALARKAMKKTAVPDRPLLLAIADPGRLLDGGRWGRLNTLIGDDQLVIRPDDSTSRERADNGFLAGVGEWRNSAVSAIAFTSEALPTFGESSIEIWVNGGAAHPLPLAPFEVCAQIVAARDGVLMQRPAGRDKEWVPAGLD